MFEAMPEANLEIHTGMMASAILSDTIPCDRLCISEGNDSELTTIDLHDEQKNDNSRTLEIQKKRNLETVESLTTAYIG